MSQVAHVAAYKFAPLQNLRPLRAQLRDQCREWNLKGTILLSPEGINLFVAGSPDAIEQLLAQVRTWPGFHDLEAKISFAPFASFNRMLVRIKKEIIAFGLSNIAPAQHTSPKLPARTLKEWLDAGKPLVLLDTRNDYEVKLGTFQNALPIGIHHFRDFPNAVRQLPAHLKDETIVMFCTGGIRCEKAGPLMEQEGFKNVLQLEGGILKYFEECGGAHYNGECFVFDQRVGVTPALEKSPSAQCFACLEPLTPAEQSDPRYIPGKSCPHCFKSEQEELALRRAQRESALQKITSPLPGSIPRDNDRPIHIPLACDGALLIDALASIVRSLSTDDWRRDFDLHRILDAKKIPAPPSRIVRAGERFYRRLPAEIEPDVATDIRVLHEDSALLVLHKPAPLPMHPSGRFCRNTLQNFVHLAFYPEKPHPAHRLDANTTGVVAFAKTRRYATLLQPQFATGAVHKSYLVRVVGHPPSDTFDCAAPIAAEPTHLGARQIESTPNAGQPAHTLFRVLQRFPDSTSLLEAQPKTGRTNQIRAHLWFLGFPIVGDPTYRQGFQLGDTQTLALHDPPLCLHAWKLAFTHPLSGQPVSFEAPPPPWSVVP